MGELRCKRIARTSAEASKRARVEPATWLVAVDHAPCIRNEVTAIADHDRVAVEHFAELCIQAHRVQRGRRVLALSALALAPLGLDSAQLADPTLAVERLRACRRAQVFERRRKRAIAL